MFKFWKSKDTKTTNNKALVDKAIKDLHNGNVESGLEALHKLAEKNDPEAEFTLGDVHEFGLENYEEAFIWYERAAEHGHSKARFCLANMYMAGKGTEVDYQEAVRWYQLAAKDGIPDAQFMMGEFLRVGKVIPQDLAEAKRWYELASRNGTSQAQERLNQMKEGIGTKPSPGPIKNAVFYKDIQHIPKEQLMSEGLGYFLGDTRPQDFKQAAVYVEAAAQKGLVDAQYMIGKMYMGGQGVAQNYEKAFSWLKKAAEQDHADSAFEVARFYANGVAVGEDQLRAEEYIRKAASLGHETSIEILKKRS